MHPDLWDSMDYVDGVPEILELVGNRPGHVQRKTPFGEAIFDLASNNDLKTFVEIGPMEGLGTTKCLLDGLMLRSDRSKLISVETNAGFAHLTKQYWAHYFEKYDIDSSKLSVLHGGLVRYADICTTKVTDSGHTIETYPYHQDLLTAPHITLDIPVDVLCLDGGHFTTEMEWNMFKDKIKAIILDDTETSKTREILAEIEFSDDWDIIYETGLRNGELIAIRNNYK
jgi:hypothetical protein